MANIIGSMTGWWRGRSGRAVAILGAVALAMGVAAPGARGEIVYVAGSAGQFGTFDTASKAFTNIATTSRVFFGLALTPGGTLYGVANGSNDLFTINTTTGAVKDLGALSIPQLTITANAAGALFGIDLATAGSLDSIDPTSLKVTTIGPTGASTQGSLAFGGNGDLYETIANVGTTDTLARLDTATGAGTTVGDTGFANIFGLASAGGTMFGFDTVNDLLTINLASGLATQDGKYGLPGGGFVEAAAVVPVPEPSSMALTAAGAALVAGSARRRRARAGGPSQPCSMTTSSARSASSARHTRPDSGTTRGPCAVI